MLLLMTTVVSPSAVASTDTDNSFDCQRLAEAEMPTTPVDWLERSMLASQCYLFQARAVRISREGVRTLALVHEIHDGVVREVASYLDGPAVVYERYGRVGRNAVLINRAAGGSQAADLDHVERYYRLTLGGEERIAGRSSMRLDVQPLDEFRYGHRLWLDRETGLPLKQNLIDGEGQILETFQMTELDKPTLYDKPVALEPVHDMPLGPWQPGWLPAGYTLAPLPPSPGFSGKTVSHRLYSDGLSSFSLFVEPLEEGSKALLPGLHRLGISHAAVRHLSMNDRVMQVVVMGELPPEVLHRVASQLQYRSVERAQREPGP
ncbi:MucB/RseB C-terminal domain-containing protein [Modicisalibacter ilicicola]|uniref:MucB/RseB C-terminal domain-containing protein n=1 Tax=Modicisalibacter ilicicola TaxID=480814 RepID=UPI001FE762A6|nr:MucB/RseB C-terminal domain-containing protein [Halomonas ilicicola]